MNPRACTSAATHCRRSSSLPSTETRTLAWARSRLTVTPETVATQRDLVDGSNGRIHAEAGDEITDKLLDALTEGPQILVGSSMGGWIALRMVQELNKGKASDRIAGLVLLAPAPDFTSDLHEPKLTEAQRDALQAAAGP